MTALAAPKALATVLIALAVSLAGNALLTRLWLSSRDDAATAAERTAQALGDAKLCSDGAKAVLQASEIKTAEAEKAIAAARNGAKTLRSRADRTLATPATSADDCKAAGDVVDAWLTERAKP